VGGGIYFQNVAEHSKRKYGNILMVFLENENNRIQRVYVLDIGMENSTHILKQTFLTAIY